MAHHPATLHRTSAFPRLRTSTICNAGNRHQETLGRALYEEIAMIEEQHVSHYESLLDPSMTWFERAVMHEYHEACMYWSCMEEVVV